MEKIQEPKLIKTAIITGAGQDATHLSKILLEQDYRVIVATRRSSTGATNWRFIEAGLYDSHKFKVVHCDINEFFSVFAQRRRA